MFNIGLNKGQKKNGNKFNVNFWFCLSFLSDFLRQSTSVFPLLYTPYSNSANATGILQTLIEISPGIPPVSKKCPCILRRAFRGFQATHKSPNPPAPPGGTRPPEPGTFKGHPLKSLNCPSNFPQSLHFPMFSGGSRGAAGSRGLSHMEMKEHARP